MADWVDEIKIIDQRILELEAEKQQLLHKRQSLIQQQNSQTQSKLTIQQKISVFESLFKGRTDIFATRWQSTKGRSGYSVACDNEWVKGLCEKPRIKCSECVNRKYTLLNQQVLYDHLSGRQVVGLYPLLPDNSCYLLAADFDKAGWQDAVKAMSEACSQFDIPHTIEVSRSGNGAHLWIFFSEPVQAKEVRLLGFSLLDKAMEIYPSLSFDAYDRLFPSQDIMPEGGFGNLIALPLQKEARKSGYSCFVGQSLLPYSDQWDHLAQIKTVSQQTLSKLLSQISPSLIQPQEQDLADRSLPWEQTAKIKPLFIENPPKRITVTLANHFYLKLSETPALLIAQLRKLASFSNPVFFKTQALRFSTHGIPRFITCAKIEQGYLALPRGCADEAIDLLKEQNISIDINDKRQEGIELKGLKLLVKLRENQSLAVKIMSKHDTGILYAPTAFGKTVTAIGIIAKRKTNTLILTHSRQLLSQWQERLQTFLPGVEVGVIGGGKKKPTGLIDIATYQSLINKRDNTVDSIVQNYGQVIVDECHHVSAPRFEMVLNEARAKFVLGLTATPDRQDGHQKIIFMTVGPIRHKMKPNHGAQFKQEVIVTQIDDQPPEKLVNPAERPKISDVYQWILENDNRTQRIIDDVLKHVVSSKHPLVLTERRAHAERIHKLLIENGVNSVILKGSMRAVERRKVEECLHTASVVVATGKYVGEGFDLPRLDTLFLAMPIAWKGSLAQYAGRIHRESEGKDEVTIFDYVDINIPMLERMFKKREKSYKTMGYSVKSSCTSSSG
ncbi:TOTE conflict system archaeo-eukaryotic primase domain-containing protein [Leucothrix mucor]|uniref:TOTE conflict system archaeo-eukaryotic primase domain-containing protein n=1 Tax=Leucothrix mucor TaxID=45248 RepID=UPI0003B79390|nr:DEAD/DEAH box helicase [Leucothrix mucor]